ncbi:MULTISPECIES: ZIP family metal transporter [Erysipelotrichaceae]|jgi:ZIP family zinc transporter|uniref:ZIP family metal transporter n=2 Tax=Amedibacillus TaxID=2749846 RepID=A0A7G9GTC3_9FIRM|nr:MULTISPECIES: ZIP family metal transporter [Erysipelotrichaceae]QNM14055.1 ZIP family metal transporter [[Eubacterium] hominis]MCH4285845.1 ZIP family metal transporter [Amedibacillus hominis]RGB50231.1 ZIP family metal transporter [Absiella sp. AM22-9]RGB57002.1 ZIP family metal transporter [Absiella sp. AM10-20]RGB66931.1 ZIP family metal transporter [Absiella sp. AM09-45]
MGILGTLILTTAISGVVGTGLGGLIGALFRKDSNKTVSLLLSFAGGVMLSVVCFDLIQEAIATGTHIFIVITSILTGVAIIYILNYLIDKRTNPEVPHINKEHPQTADNLDELIHSDHLEQHYKKKDKGFSLFIAGIVMASAIALHNVPEGMTIGASYASNDGVMGSAALMLAILIGLHNIPEGMAVSVPLISGGMHKTKAVLITALSGAPTIIGALFGYWLGDIGDLGLAISLGFASGAMLYVVFGEIFPQSILMYRSKRPAFFTILGVMVGLLIIYA